MKVVAVSDLHGFLPPVPKCDLLLIAGDICPVQDHRLDWQRYWMEKQFWKWLGHTKAKHIVGVWGNHDWIGEKCIDYVYPTIPWTVLTDQLVEIEGLRIWGLPWQREFNNWAFNLTEPELDKKYDMIPECDIIVSHGPPYGYGDRNEEGELCGSRAFVQAIDRTNPKLCVFGHIHEGSGTWTRGVTTLANVTLIDRAYRMVHKPMVFEL